MNDKTIELLNQTDIDGLHGRLAFGSRHYHEVQQAQAVQTAAGRWRLLTEVRGTPAPQRGNKR
jgi:hypothetical protein